MMRLDRFLANQGFGTRKEVKKLILSKIKFPMNHQLVVLS